MAEGQALRRELSLGQAVAVGVGAMVDGGIAITFSEALPRSQGGIWVAPSWAQPCCFSARALSILRPEAQTG